MNDTGFWVGSKKDKKKRKKKRTSEILLFNDCSPTEEDTGTENSLQFDHTNKKKSKNSVVFNSSQHSQEDKAVFDIPCEESNIQQEVKKKRKGKKRKKCINVNGTEETYIADVLPLENMLGSEENENLPSPMKNGISEKNLIVSPDVIPIEDVWPIGDLQELLDKIMATLPENDTLKYSSRVSKIDWENISFGKYSSNDCSKMWNFIQSRLRRYRLLGELIAEAKNLVNSKNFIKGKLMKHPEEPSKPLTSFMLYYMKRKDSVLKKNPGIGASAIAKIVSEMYQNLSARKKQRYMDKAKMLRTKYEEDLEIFYQKYPEHRPVSNKKKKKNELFDKPLSAFKRYLKAMTETYENDENFDKGKLLDNYRENWKQMSNQQKLIWIKETQKDESEYWNRLKKHSEQHPEFSMPTFKSVLTKDELKLLKVDSGVPKKPPSSSYSLFSQMMLQDDNIRTVASKDRLALISKKWKELSDREKDFYTTKLKHMQEQHKLEYASYLETLTEEQKTEELHKSKPKKKKIVEKNKNSKHWPLPPPLDVYELFKQKLQSRNQDKHYSKNEEEEIAQEQFKELSEDQLKLYRDELDKLQMEYMAQIDHIVKGSRESTSGKGK